MNKQLADFYKDKRVLITGNTGFKGSWLSLVLSHFGARLSGYSQNGIPDNQFSKMVMQHTGIKQKFGDINDKETLGNWVAEQQPDLLFHMAAQPLVSEAYADPYTTLQSNVSGTLSLLEIMRLYSRKCALIMITSDKCYKIYKGKTEYTEQDELGGFDPYSLSKAMQEQLVKLYYDNYFSKTTSAISCCTIRSGNVIGGGDFSASRLIPDLVKSVDANEKIMLRNPLAVRPWIYILDSLSAYLLAGKALAENHTLSGESFNAGPGKKDQLNVAGIVQLFMKEYAPEKDIPVVQDGNEHYKESEHLFLSTEKIKTVLGWKTTYSIDRSVTATAKWYAEFHTDEEKIISFTLKEIGEFFENVL